MSSLSTIMSLAKNLPSNFRLIIYIVLLYITFVYWGILQEKITTHKYESIKGSSLMIWRNPFVLNLFMSISSLCTSELVNYSMNQQIISSPSIKNSHKHLKQSISFLLFWKHSLAACLASPIGYESLKYINYPVMVLAKASKPLPTMFISHIFYKHKYNWYQYINIILLCCGVFLFTVMKSSIQSTNIRNESIHYNPIYGIILILINLSLDGYTSNEQDHIFTKYSASSNQMMNYTNLWQCIYHILYLGICYFIQSDGGEIVKACHMLLECPALKYDIAMFCLCASIGQILLFSVMQEFGSLVWIMISITRQLFTIILSILLFGHQVNIFQWFGIMIVFICLGNEIIMKHYIIDSNFKLIKIIKDNKKVSGNTSPRKYTYKIKRFSSDESVESIEDIETNKPKAE